MSTVSEEEKRRILRERRLNKIKKSADARLNKITGGTHKSKEEDVANETKPNLDDKNGTTAATATGINNDHDGHDDDDDDDDAQDPGMEDISKYEPIIDKEAQEFQKALHQLLRSDKHQHQYQQDQTTTTPDFDLFNQLLSGAIPQGSNGFPGFDLGGINSDFNTSPPPTLSEEQSLLQRQQEYKRVLNDKYKAKFLIIKFLIFCTLTLSFIFISTDEFNYKSSINPIIRYNHDNNLPFFFKIFTTLEVILTGFYHFHLLRQKDTEYNYQYNFLIKYLGYIPDSFVSRTWKNRIRLLVKYLELINFILFDIAVIIVTFGAYALFFQN